MLHLEDFGARLLGLRREDLHDFDAVEQEVGFDLADIAGGGIVIEQGGVQNALGLFGPGRSPRPRPVFPVTREFNFNTARHQICSYLDWTGEGCRQRVPEYNL